MAVKKTKTAKTKAVKTTSVKSPAGAKKKSEMKKIVTAKKPASAPKMAIAKKAGNVENSQMVDFFDYTLKTLEHYINERAYYIWEEKGFSQDQGETCWKQAEQEILHALIRK